MSDRTQTPETPEPERVPTPAVESAPAAPAGGLALGQLGSVEAVLALQQSSGNQAVDRVMRGQAGTGETTLPGALGAALVSGLGGWGGAGAGAGSGPGDSGAGDDAGDDDAGGGSQAGATGEGGATEAGDDVDAGLLGDAGADGQDDGESFNLRPREPTATDRFVEPGPGITGRLEPDGGAAGVATRESWARGHAGQVPARARSAQAPVLPGDDALERRRQVEALRDMTGAGASGGSPTAATIAAIDDEDAARARNDAARAQLEAWRSRQAETGETPS